MNDLTLVIIPDATHIVLFEAPEAFNIALQ